MVHHLYGANKYPQLTYKEKNGIVLSKPMHQLFHKTYGYRDNDLKQFLTFLSDLLLSSKSKQIKNQASHIRVEGSETIVLNEKHIQILYQRLKSISLVE